MLLKNFNILNRFLKNFLKDLLLLSYSCQKFVKKEDINFEIYRRFITYNSIEPVVSVKVKEVEEKFPEIVSGDSYTLEECIEIIIEE